LAWESTLYAQNADCLQLRTNDYLDTQDSWWDEAETCSKVTLSLGAW